MTLRIGLPLIGNKGWHGGVTYLDSIIHSFLTLPVEKRPSLWLILGMDAKFDLTMHSDLASLVDGIIEFNPEIVESEYLHVNHIQISNFVQIEELVDFIFPVNFDALPGFNYATWIPDLQHKYLHHLFSSGDIISRDDSMQFIANAAPIIIVSSQSTKQDLIKYYPKCEDRIEVVHFYSNFDIHTFEDNHFETVHKYSLPDRFVICCNQFWQHKNHDNLFRALAKTKSKLHLVCTGADTDYRNPEWFPYIQNLIAELQLESRVTLLGLIPRKDQIQLLRKAIGIVQPSLFEGWSTVMEDARALGKSVIASNIPVHLEQNVNGAEYFNPTSIDEIATCLDNLETNGVVGPNIIAEHQARHNVRKFQTEVAKQMLRIAQTSAGEINDIYGNQPLSRILVEKSLTEKLILAKRRLNDKQIAINYLLESPNTDQLKALIDKQKHELNNMQDIVRKLRPLIWILQPIKPLVKPFRFWINKLTSIFSPRLGNLNQYSPRKLTSVPLVINNSTRRLQTISIVTPSFNQGAFLERTLLSVFTQSYPFLQYFVQDGGSKDNTVSVLKKYEENLSGWISEPDNGQSQAINKGFLKTSGEIMGWLNSDDLLLPGALRIVANYFNDYPDIDVVYGNRLLIDENDMEIGRWILPKHDNNVLSWVDYIPQETMFWRRSLWDKVGGNIDESFKFAMDWDLIVRFRDNGAKFSHLPNFLGAFRIHEKQKTSNAINEIGYQEMNRIRERILGRVPLHNEIRIAVFPYMLKHIFIDIIYRIKDSLHNKNKH